MCCFGYLMLVVHNWDDHCKTSRRRGGLSAGNRIRFAKGVYTVEVIEGMLASVTHRGDADTTIDVSSLGLADWCGLGDNYGDYCAAFVKEPLPREKIAPLYKPERAEGTVPMRETFLITKEGLSRTVRLIVDDIKKAAANTAKGSSHDIQTVKNQLETMKSEKGATALAKARAAACVKADELSQSSVITMKVEPKQ